MGSSLAHTALTSAVRHTSPEETNDIIDFEGEKGNLSEPRGSTEIFFPFFAPTVNSVKGEGRFCAYGNSTSLRWLPRGSPHFPPFVPAIKILRVRPPNDELSPSPLFITLFADNPSENIFKLRILKQNFTLQCSVLSPIARSLPSPRTIRPP